MHGPSSIDLLWVRETWQHTDKLNIHPTDDQYGFVYKADHQPWDDYEGWRWKPSIHMPKDAARIWLKVTSIRAERLRSIDRDGCLAEGIGRSHLHSTQYLNYRLPGTYTYSERVSFRSLWESIHGQESWASNPWVWVIKYEVLSTIGLPVKFTKNMQEG